MDPSQEDPMNFESEFVENGSELMAMDMRTQSTSQNDILESPNLDFGFLGHISQIGQKRSLRLILNTFQSGYAGRVLCIAP